MENDLIDSLKDIGYTGPLLSHDTLHEALEIGLKSSNFRKLVIWLAEEIRVIGGFEENIGDLDVNEQGDDLSCFLMELSSFLKELGCPYDCLVSGHMSGRMQTTDSRILLINHLISELMTLRMIESAKPSDITEITFQESTTANALKRILLAFGFSRPPDNISAAVLFTKLITKLKDIVKLAGPERVGKALLCPTKPLSDQQWLQLDKIERELSQEYKLRRTMLLTRLDVTIQSFQWSDKAKGRQDDISRLYTTKRLKTVGDGISDVGIPGLIAAREDLAILEKTSNASVRRNTQSTINKVVIGKVPDRGGRTSEQAPPPPEMPSWQNQRSAGPSAGGRGGRGGGQSSRGSGGGNFNQTHPQSAHFSSQDNTSGASRVQGQWNQSSGQATGGGYSNRGGSYNSGGGAGYDNQQRGSFSARSHGGYDNQNTYTQGYQGSGGYKQGGRGAQNYSQDFQGADGYNQTNDGYNQGTGGYNQGGRGGRGRGRNNYNRGNRY